MDFDYRQQPNGVSYQEELLPAKGQERRSLKPRRSLAQQRREVPKYLI